MYQLVNRRKVRSLRKMRFWRRRKTDLAKPRLCIFRSSRHIQAQVFDDKNGIVLASASSIEAELKATSLTGKNMAAKIGSLIAERAIKAGVAAVVFDRNGFSYHGRIKALAESARESGLGF